MSWEQRGSRRYYYRARRVRGRLVREYVGTGEVAEVAARLDAEAAAERALRRVERMRTQTELEELEVLFERIDREVDTAVSTAMAMAGFHRHRGRWRRKRAMTTTEAPDAATAAPEQPVATTRNELIRRAQSGDPVALGLLRSLFDDPKMADAFGGNIALRSTQIVIHQMAGPDLLTEEAIQRKMGLLRAELAGPNPAPLESLVVDRIVALWLHLHKLEGEAAMVGTQDASRAAFYQRAISSAQGRYFHAIRELTHLRRNATPPIEVSVVNEVKG